jgi:tRNA nucleotidyltransferase (CCA-adding enzyme)
VLPELLPMVGFAQNNPHHRKDVWEHTLAVLENIPAEPALRWAALLHDVEKPSCCTTDEEGIRHFKGHQEKSAATAEKILRRLHAETTLITEVTELIKIHDIRFPATVEMATRWAGRWGEKRFLRFAALRRADTLGQAHPEEAEPYYRALTEAFGEAKRKNACFTVRQLAVTGNDLTAMGLAGPAVGETLRRLLQGVQSGALPNERAALLAAAGQQE